MPQVLKRLGLVFVSSFILNFFWEHAHAPLYSAYQGGVITNFILFHASLGDAVMLTLLAVPFLYSTKLRQNWWLIVPLGFIVAVLVEYYGLSTSRWAYGPTMPLVPFLHVGLTPFLQLALTGLVIWHFCIYRKSYEQ